MREERPLFVGHDGFTVARAQRSALLAEIDGFDGDALLGSGIEGLLDHVEQQFELDVPVLHESAIETDQEEIAMTEPSRHGSIRRVGTLFRFHIPFTGSPGLFDVQPSVYGVNPPYGFVAEDELRMQIKRWSGEDASTVRREFDGQLETVRSSLDQLRKDFAGFNAGLRDVIQSRIDERRKKLLADRQTVGSLGFAVRQRPDAPRTYIAPIQRRKFAPRPKRASAPFQPEPEFDQADYERALEIVANMGKVIEQSPDTFDKFDEEDLRNQFLIQLNGQFEGGATGETFRGYGKTDIQILVDGRAIFIAECKIYKGPKSVSDALDQLLGYATWRDTKLALLIFSRQRDFSTVLRSTAETVQAHECTVARKEYRSETGFRFVIRRKDDPEREMTLTVLLFPIPPQRERTVA